MESGQQSTKPSGNPDGELQSWSPVQSAYGLLQCALRTGGSHHGCSVHHGAWESTGHMLLKSATAACS